MRLFEYQAKELFREAGIPVPHSTLVRAGECKNGSQFAAETGKAAEALLSKSKALGSQVVLKAQLLMGGRGKAGLIQFVPTAAEAAAQANTFFSGEHSVRNVLVEEAIHIASELYLSILPDPATASLVILASAEGGVEIEELAVTQPDAIMRTNVDINRNLQTYQARSLAHELGLSGETARQFVKTLALLYRLFLDNDAELVEINPLFVTGEGNLVAGDGKVVIDDNSLFRQTKYQWTREHFESDAEFEAAQEGIPYLQFDGDISLMCAGAGLTTTVFDLVHYEGGTIANYLEFGGPNYRKAKRAMELCLKNESRVILIVTFGTIARADVMARGVVDAITMLKPDRPIVTCIRGTNEETAVSILKDAGLDPLFDTEEAVHRAVMIAGEGDRV